MKALFDGSLSLINMIAMVLNFFPLQKSFHYKNLVRRIILYSISSLFFITFYVFGYIALYYYLAPLWGDAIAASSLCLFSLVIGVALILITRLLKAKKKRASPPTLPLLEKSLEQMLNAQDLTKILKQTSPKVLIGLFGVVALTSFLVIYKKKR